MSVNLEVMRDRIALLEAIRSQDKTWEALAPRYGVTNPNPPWKTSLTAMCDCLAVSGALPWLDQRKAEDELAETLYSDVPSPERQLLALVHTIVSRGLMAEADLAGRMSTVRARLEAV